LQGIIFTGGACPSARIIKHLIDTEAKNPLLIAADSGLLAIEGAGLKPDWIIGDMDSLDTAARLDAYPPDRVIRYDFDKDFTDTELAFSHAVEKGCDDIWIIGGGGGRIDHLFGIRSMFEREIFPSRWITDNADMLCIKADNRELEPSVQRAENSFFYSIEKGSVVSVFPLGNSPWEAESTGLKWPLAGLPWERGFFGLSNIAVDGKFSIEVKKGRFMVILPVEEIKNLN